MHASKVAAVRRARSACAVAVALMLAAPRAFACGTSADGAANVSTYNLDKHLESVRPKWRAGASYAYNSKLNACRLRDLKYPAQTPAIFESSANRWNAADPLDSFLPRHQRRGHCRRV